MLDVRLSFFSVFFYGFVVIEWRGVEEMCVGVFISSEERGIEVLGFEGVRRREIG